DPARCAGAGVPQWVRFATKITLARRMLARALEAGLGAAWATADEFYGGDRYLRQDLQARGVGYVLAVAKSHRVITCAPLGPQRVDQITAELPRRSWNRRSAGEGSKGWRDYDWAWIMLAASEAEAAAGGEHYLLVRRSRTTVRQLPAPRRAGHRVGIRPDAGVAGHRSDPHRPGRGRVPGPGLHRRPGPAPCPWSGRRLGSVPAGRTAAVPAATARCRAPPTRPNRPRREQPRSLPRDRRRP